MTRKIKCLPPQKPSSPEIVDRIKVGFALTPPSFIEPSPKELVDIFEYIDVLEAIYPETLPTK